MTSAVDSPRPVKIGLIGCGAISGAYLTQCPKFEILRIAACADLLPERAKARAEEFGVPKACSVEELLADPEIEIVVNLTVPRAHFEVSLAAVQAGKSVWGEKPLSVTREQGRALLDAAEEAGVLVGCAPDTFLGAGLQTCVKAIDDGLIGEPIGASAYMMSRGPEGWHADPEFFYKAGGGPMFDMGPYYLTALVALLGPARRVTGSARISFPERLITSEPKRGTVIKVDVPTHISGIVDFAQGAIATITTSFDVWASRHPLIEVYGSEGTLDCPDPNGTGGPVRLWREGEWSDLPLSHPYETTSRSVGVADLAYALRSGRPHRASGDLAFHVLDMMHAFHDASDEDRHILLESTCARPAPMRPDLPEGVLDL